MLLEPGPRLTIQTVMDDFYTTFAEELTSRRDPAHAFVKFTEPQQLWLRQRMNIVKPVRTPGDLLLWLSGVPHCSHAAGEHSISRRGLFITANLRRNADAKALKERLAKVKMGKIGTHNCRNADAGPGLVLRDARHHIENLVDRRPEDRLRGRILRGASRAHVATSGR